MSIDPNGAGAKYVQDIVDQITEANKPEDVPSHDARMLALSWLAALLAERAVQGDEVADALISSMLVLGSGAPIADVLRELSFLESRRNTAPQMTNPVASVPPPPPMVPRTPPQAPPTPPASTQSSQSGKGRPRARR